MQLEYFIAALVRELDFDVFPEEVEVFQVAYRDGGLSNRFQGNKSGAADDVFSGLALLSFENLYGDDLAISGEEFVE